MYTDWPVDAVESAIGTVENKLSIGVLARPEVAAAEPCETIVADTSVGDKGAVDGPIGDRVCVCGVAGARPPADASLPSGVLSGGVLPGGVLSAELLLA